MNDFLRDPIWQFIGAILAVVAIVISIYLFYLQRNKKSLLYDVLLDYSLLSPESGLESRIQILFDEKVVQNVSIFVIRIYNDGNIPILATDFVEPLIFSFGTTAKILEAGVAECYPVSLKPKILISTSNVTLEPLLLNGGDSITLKLLLSKDRKFYEPSARIVGVSKLRKGSISNQYFAYSIFGLGLVFSSSVGFGILSILLMSPDEKVRQIELVRQQLPWIIGIGSIAIIGITITIFSIIKLMGQFKTYSEISIKYNEGKSNAW